MFGIDFFPTPEDVVEKMLSGIDLRKIKTVLEPSAGKGNIIEVIREKERGLRRGYSQETIEIDAIEIDPSLRAILEQKDIRVIGSDFLTTQIFTSYDLLIMNPPFTTAQAHLEKAMTIQSELGGWLVCLLPASFIKNPHSRAKVDIVNRLKEADAHFSYLKEAFVDAERQTGVEVAIVKVFFEKPKRESIILETLQTKRHHQSRTANQNALVRGSEFEAIEELYQHEVALMTQLYDDFVIIKESTCLNSELSLKLNQVHADRNALIMAVRQKYWDLIFKTQDFQKLLTQSAQREIAIKTRDLLHYDINVFNILELRRQLSLGFVSSMEESIIEIFDKLSFDYAYMPETKKNVLHYNGWKTNIAYKINNNVIYPMQTFDKIFNRFYLSSSQEGFLLDIEKVFKYLSADLICVKQSQDLISEARDSGLDFVNLKYFNLKFYKKGTVHIVFTDALALERFNQFVATKRAWLPPVSEWQKTS